MLLVVVCIVGVCFFDMLLLCRGVLSFKRVMCFVRVYVFACV